jgi:putative membrane-bound dehydrogenase-like protein
MPFAFGSARRAAALALFISGLVTAAEIAPATGPETEKRFPPLLVPAGFRATLFACDPLVEYPSVLAAGPRPDAFFVAADYMTGLGVEIVRHDEVRLVEDTDHDGYADRATVVATGFNSIQGLAYDAGTLFVMHAPWLSALNDPDGDGRFEDRRDLLSGLGLPPEKNSSRLHCANGVVPAGDGWLYLALGDNGCDVPRREGDRLVFHGGGILRCRPDGSDLHVFSTGLRNIYDIALDDDRNVFVRDNENDGGDYMIRVAHSFFGADHGYPYLYYERPAEALRPLADLGRGSSGGGACYVGAAFPPEYRGNLFFCEWGRAVMRYRPQHAGSAFAPMEQIEFASGAPDDPYGFKPTDLVVARDGALLVADWGDGQRPKRGRGRIYRITAAPVPDRPPGNFQPTNPGLSGQLDAVWTRARDQGPASIPALLDLARRDPEPRVQIQAVRALADLADPVLAQHRLDAGPGDPELAGRLAALAEAKDPRVVLEVVIAVGRLRWAGAPAWLQRTVANHDPALEHAAMQTLRRSGQWDAVLRLLDEPDVSPIRAIALRALADRYEPAVVDGLIARLGAEPRAARRSEYADLLTRVARQPGPWKYWGYRPPPRPASAVAWERTDAVVAALDRVLADPDRGVRLAILRRIDREQIPTRLETIASWLRDETDPAAVSSLIAALRAHPAASARTLLEAVIDDPAHPRPNRLAALELWTTGLDAAGLEALPALGHRLLAFLDDPDPSARRLATVAVGRLGVRSAIERLLVLARDPDPGVCNASLDALRRLREPRAVPVAVAALGVRDMQLEALHSLEDLGGPEQIGDVVALARQSPTTDVLHQAVEVLSRWSRREGLSPALRAELQRAVAVVQGQSGIVALWQLAGLVDDRAITALVARVGTPSTALEPSQEVPQAWVLQRGSGLDSQLRLRSEHAPEPASSWVVAADVEMDEPSAVQFLASSSGGLRVWCNGRPVYERPGSRTYAPDSDRFDATLDRGPNRLIAAIAPAAELTPFHLRFRRKGSTAERERLMQRALAQAGNAERGRAVFGSMEKAPCLKCHRLGDQGTRIGPDLTAVGSRFPRAYLIESILEPSRTIAPSFEAVAVALTDGRVLTGVRTAETETTLTLADAEGKTHTLPRAEIEAQRPQAASLMPDGLEKPLTPDEFVDLIAFLVGQK